MIRNAANKSAAATFLSSDIKTTADGSVDLYFGPKAPKGLENNWVEMVRPGSN